MTGSSATSDQPGRRSGWLVLTASERGASHIATHQPNQDSVASERAGSEGMVAAVADGHGHSRHLRSARGSNLAVRIGCQVAQELADQLESDGIFAQPGARPGGHTAERRSASAMAEVITGLMEDFLVPQIVGRWREAVLADVAVDPFTQSEDEQRQKGDDATIAYGSTLLVSLALHDWLILAQIGDGDVVAVRPDGGAIQPVPVDPHLDGLVTTSLCGPDARSDFRLAIVDTSKVPLLAVLLATDGYGNAQVVEEWPSAFSQDLAWMLQERDVHWVASQLPGWAARCASSDGSADDTTVALLLSPVATASQTTIRPIVEQDIGSEETTIPAVPHAATVPNSVAVAEKQSAEPATAKLPAFPVDELSGQQQKNESPAGAGSGMTHAEHPARLEEATSAWEPPGADGR